MVNSVDITIVIKSTMSLTTKQLGNPRIPLAVCTESYSLYDCLVKLGSTTEKRLVIDIMALRESCIQSK